MDTVQGFRLERDLSNSFGPIVSLLFGSSNPGAVVVLEQPNINGIIPDFLAGQFHGMLPDFPRKPLTGTDAYVLSKLREIKKLAVKELSSTLFISESAASRCIQKLVKTGFVSLSEHGIIEATDVLGPTSIEVAAVEMKLSRWREALEQAHAYKNFANFAYVVLDGSRVKASSLMIDTFRRAGVGLILQSGQNIQQLCPAQRCTFMSAARVQAVQKLRLSCSSSSQTRVSAPAPECV
jgi:hypothetical protein